MKLLTRGTLMFVGVTLVVFAGGSWLFYSFLSDLVAEEAEERIAMNEVYVVDALDNDSIVEESPLAPDVKIKPAPGFFEEYVIDTFLYDHVSEEMIPNRRLTFHYEKNGQHYAISIHEPLLEQDDLIEGVFTSFIIVLLLLAVFIIIGMQVLSRNTWKPFLSTLKIMEEFRPGAPQSIDLPDSNIVEFRQMNESIEKMMANTNAAFQSLKSFSENAAHEIQTPLAVIQSTTEVLLQDETLSEHQYKTISHLSSTTSRLSSIVSTLLLLTRIENKQFEQINPIDLSEVVNTKLQLFRELFDQKGIAPRISVLPYVQVKLHKVLAEIVVSNLIVNAVRHTKEGGSVSVLLTQHEFTVRNSGLPLKGDASRIFDRFYKEDQSEISTGLGLSLVKMATDVSGLQVSYRFENGEHVFSVVF